MSGITYDSLDVLVIDSSFEMRGIVRNMLRTIGVGCVRDAMRTDIGKEMVQEKDPGLIITDWNETCNGLDFAKWVRTNNLIKRPFVPIILMSQEIDAVRLTQACNAGVNGFLIKPFSGDKLKAQIRKIVEKPKFYVDTAGYHGPCRRTMPGSNDYAGQERRQLAGGFF